MAAVCDSALLCLVDQRGCSLFHLLDNNGAIVSDDEGCNQDADNLRELHQPEYTTKQMIGLASEIKTVESTTLSGSFGVGCFAEYKECRYSCDMYPDAAWNAYTFDAGTGDCKCVYIDTKFPADNIMETDQKQVVYLVPST